MFNTDITPSSLPYQSSAKCAYALPKFNMKLLFKQSKRFISQSTFFFLQPSCPHCLHRFPPHSLRIFGIDTFEAYDAVGFHHPGNYEKMMQFITQNSFDSVRIIIGDFSALAVEWKQPIDILQIDGIHTMVSAKRHQKCLCLHFCAAILSHSCAGSGDIRLGSMTAPCIHPTQRFAVYCAHPLTVEARGRSSAPRYIV